jgi:hypothetical protein
MPEERLAELLRQRALLSQHVAWLDAEIARASGASGSLGIPPAPAPAPLPSPPQPIITAAPAAIAVAAVAPAPAADEPAEPAPEPVSEAVALANKRADEIIANYAATESFNPESTRRSCLLLAIAVFLIGSAALIGIYLFNYR